MRNDSIYALAIVLALSCLADATQIKLKRQWNLLVGWKYSINNKPYEKLDESGMDLYGEMAGNDAAQKEMLDYKPNRIAGDVCAYIGGFTTLGTLAAAILTGGWSYDYWPSMIGGCTLLTGSVICFSMADRHLKRAVRIFNGQGQETIGLSLSPQMTACDRGIRAAVVVSF